MGRNIEDDLSSIHQLDQGEYLITDPQLLREMVLEQDIRKDKAVFVTKGTELTANLIEKIQELGIESVCARHVVDDAVEKAADEMNDLFIDVKSTLYRDGVRSVHEALARLKKNGWDGASRFRESLPGLLEEIVSRFSPYAAEGVRDIHLHDQNTTLHSVETALQMVEMAQTLGWSRDRVLQAGLAGLLHDVGKAGVPVDILNHPGELSDLEFKAVQAHPLIGYILLSNNEDFRDQAAFCAGTHHEHFQRSNRSYGIRTTNRDHVSIDLDGTFTVEEKEIADLATICDVHSALGESNDYKVRKFPLELLMVMNLEARHGKFNPAFYRTWYDKYRERHPLLLQKGYSFPIPSTMRRQLARRPLDKMILPVFEERFTFSELTRLGLIPELLDKGARISELKRRNGMTLFQLEALGVQGIPDAPLEKLGIDPNKPVTYNIVVLEVLEEARGRFFIMKANDTIKDVQAALQSGLLDPIQKLCLERRNIEFNFQEEVDFPV